MNDHATETNELWNETEEPKPECTALAIRYPLISFVDNEDQDDRV